MTSERPATVVWIRLLLLVLALATLVYPVYFLLATPSVAVFAYVSAFYALPALVPLFLALVAGRRGKLVFFGVLLTAVGFLGWTLVHAGTLVTLRHADLVAQFLASVVVLVLLARSSSRAYYLTA